MFDYATNALNPTPMLVTDTARPDDRLVAHLDYCNAVVMDVPSSPDALRALHKGKFWSTLRRKERRLGDAFGDVVFHVVTDENGLRRWLPQVQQVFRERWADEYTSLSWKTHAGFAAYHDAMIALAREGQAELLVLEADGRMLSFAYCVSSGDTFYFFQHATTTDERYRRFSPGKLLVWKMVSHLVDDGRFTTLDFMLGDHDYKHEWGSRSRPVYLRISEERTASGLVRFVARRAFYGVKIYVQFHNDTLRGVAKRVLAAWSEITRRRGRRHGGERTGSVA